MLNILIVDDDPHICKLLEKILQSDYACRTAKDAAQARRRLKEYPFDLILCDILMPGESGLDLAREVSVKQPDTAVVIVSAVEDPQATQAAINLGIYGYLIKPLNKSQVRVTVSNALKRLELERAKREQLCGLETTVETRTRELEKTVAKLQQTKNALQKSKAALEEKLQFLNTLIEAIPSPIFCKDIDGRYRECNKAFEMYLDRPKQQIIGKTVHDIAPGDLAETYHQKDLELIRSGGTQVYDTAVQWSDGTRHEVVFKKATYCDASGGIAGLIGILNDRTELISVESRLRDSKVQLQAILDNIQSGVFMIRADDRVIVDANRKALELTGYRRDELLGSVCHAIICPREVGMCPVLDNSRKLENAETDLKTKQGLLPILKTVSIVQIHGERHLIESFADISEIKRTEHALKTREEKYRNIFNNMQDVYYETDMDGTILEISPSVEAEFGYTRESLIGTSVLRLWADPNRRDEVIQEIKENGRVRDYEVTLVGKDGERVHGAICTTLIKGESGHPRKLLGTLRDITERKQAEEEQQRLMNELNQTLRELQNTQSQMLHAEKMASIGQLSAGVAHEINTPTQFVGDNVRFLSESFDDLQELMTAYEKLTEDGESIASLQDRLKEIAQIVERIDPAYLKEEIPLSISQTLEGVERIAKIVRAMKEFSHPGTDEKTMFEIHSAIESTLTVAKNEWKYVADVQTDFDPELALVPCLPGDFNQVILNMITNAAHAIEEAQGNGAGKKGQITIRTRKFAPWAEIVIKDTGAGIPENIRSRIFDPFFTTKEVGKGSGQGLAIAYSVIVDKHGGSLNVESVEGEGTAFVIRLPLEESN
jgi:PAS domain S-box-containing protein